MPIAQRSLQDAAARFARTRLMTLSESRGRTGPRTAFLCHSHKDAELAKGLQVLLSEGGLEIYIDWQDTDLPDSPDRATADKIKEKIKSLDLFLFLATSNSKASRWCPWEIGVADSAKDNKRIFLITTTDQAGSVHGNEYLKLYRQITPGQLGKLVALPPGGPSNERGTDLSMLLYGL